MPSKSTLLSSPERHVTICYEDSLRCPTRYLRWHKHGIVLKTKWHFPFGTELELSLKTKEGLYRYVGFVVVCERSEEVKGMYETTIFSPQGCFPQEAKIHP